MSDPRFEGTSILALHRGAFLCAPMELDGVVLGMLYLDRADEGRPFTRFDLALFQAFVRQGSLAHRPHAVVPARHRTSRTPGGAVEAQDPQRAAHGPDRGDLRRDGLVPPVAAELRGADPRRHGGRAPPRDQPPAGPGGRGPPGVAAGGAPRGPLFLEPGDPAKGPGTGVEFPPQDPQGQPQAGTRSGGNRLDGREPRRAGRDGTRGTSVHVGRRGRHGRGPVAGGVGELGAEAVLPPGRPRSLPGPMDASQPPENRHRLALVGADAGHHLFPRRSIPFRISPSCPSWGW